MRGREGDRSRRDRAQTAQDFALGIGFFMIAVAFVFAFVPSMLAFTTADPGAKAASQADRAAESLLRDLGTGERPNEMDGTATATYFNGSATEEALRADLALSNISNVNVTIRTLDGEDVLNVTDENGNGIELTAGRAYRERQPAAEVSRVVRLTDASGGAALNCQLVVRVW